MARCPHSPPSPEPPTLITYGSPDSFRLHPIFDSMEFLPTTSSSPHSVQLHPIILSAIEAGNDSASVLTGPRPPSPRPDPPRPYPPSPSRMEHKCRGEQSHVPYSSASSPLHPLGQPTSKSVDQPQTKHGEKGRDHGDLAADSSAEADGDDDNTEDDGAHLSMERETRKLR